MSLPSVCFWDSGPSVSSFGCFRDDGIGSIEQKSATKLAWRCSDDFKKRTL